MGNSDKAHPKFVKETAISEYDQTNIGDNNVVPPKGTADKQSKKKEYTAVSTQRKKKVNEEKAIEEHEKLMKLLQRQQGFLWKSGENDTKALETMLKFQNDAEKRQQEFMESMQGKGEDISSRK